MIVVTKVEYFETTDDRVAEWRRMNFGADRMPLFSDAGAPIDESVVTEHIHGVRFCSPNGRTVVVGNAADPADLLGLQFSTFDNQSRLLEQQAKTVSELRHEIEQAHKASVWTRLRWLFKGYNAKFSGPHDAA